VGFLDPLNLLFALSIAGLILIYLRARSRSTLEVSSLMLFEEVQAAVSKIRFLKLDLLFWLEVLTLGALSLAIAGLYLKMAPATVRHRRHALVFDMAAAMGAKEGRHTRLDQAKSQALKLVGSAAPGERFAVVGFAAQAQVQRYFTTDLPSVRAAIKSLKPHDVAVAPAALAAALMRVRDADEIELFASRLPGGAAALGKLGGPRLRYHQMGHDGNNAAIVALDPGVPRSTPGHCTVRNLSAKAVLADTEITLNGRFVNRAALILPARTQGNFNFGPLPAGGVVEAQIKTPDALDADNVRYAYAAGSRSLRGVVVSPDPAVRDDLARVLRAVDPSSIVVAAAPGQFSPASIGKSLGASEPDIAIFHDTNGAGFKAAAKLFIFPPGEGKIQVKSTLPVSQMDDRTDLGPLTRPLVLGATRDLSLPAWMDPIAHGTAPRHAGVMPLAAFGVTAGGPEAVIAFDIRAHRLMDPDMMDTLVLTIDLIKDLTAPRDIHVVPTGAYVTIPASQPAKVVEPDGSTSEIAPGYANLIRFRPVYAGPYKIDIGKHREMVFANYFDAAESELSVKPGVEGEAPLSQAIDLEPSVPMRRIEPLALALMAVALAAFLIESALLLKRAITGGPTVV
jgi:von Willebrand factor type A domain/Aerotolerance regulator N-terminal